MDIFFMFFFLWNLKSQFLQSIRFTTVKFAVVPGQQRKQFPLHFANSVFFFREKGGDGG